MPMFKNFSYINSLASTSIWGFSEKKTPKRMWLCVGISLVWYALQTRQKSQKTRQVF